MEVLDPVVLKPEAYMRVIKNYRSVHGLPYYLEISRFANVFAIGPVETLVGFVPENEIQLAVKTAEPSVLLFARVSEDDISPRVLI